MSKEGFIRGVHIDHIKSEAAKAMRRRMTPAEGELWQALKVDRLDGLHFRRQQVIRGFIVDFFCVQYGLVVEVDGGVHSQQVEYDEERDRLFAGLGLHVLRISNQDVMRNMDSVLTRIRAASVNPPDPTPLPSSPRQGRGRPDEIGTGAR